MSRLPPEYIQKLRSAVNIAEIVSEHVTLKKSGQNLSGLCPFHSERTPSFYVNDKKQLFHCYGCGAGGDVISFVKDIHGLSFIEAVEELSERARLPMPRQGISSENESPEQRKRREESQKRLQTAIRLNRFAATYYRGELAASPSVRKYLSERGVNDGTEKAFFVGYARREWTGLTEHLNRAKAPLPLAAELGLIRPSTKKEHALPYFDLFRDRVMFPIIDPRGRVVGFGGRKLSSEDDGPKYLNSSESFLFLKSKLLFGLFQAQRAIRDEAEAIVTEGYFDVMTLHAYGFTNAVATCGTALSEEHLRVLSRLAPKIILMFDQDRAGQEATARAMELGLSLGLALHTVALPEGMDPDEVCLDPQLGAGVLKTWIQASKPVLDLKLDEAFEESKAGAEARTVALKRIARWLAMYQDPVGREVRVQWVLEKFQMPRSVIESWLKGRDDARSGASGPAIASTGATKPAIQVRAKSTPPVSFSKAEKILVTALVRYQEHAGLVSRIQESLPETARVEDLFAYPPAREFVANFLRKPGAYELLKEAPEWVMEGVEDASLLKTLTAALVAQDSLYRPEDVRVALGQRVYRFWARISHQLKNELEAVEAKKDKDLEAKTLKDYLDVQKKLKEFDKFYEQGDRSD